MLPSFCVALADAIAATVEPIGEVLVVFMLLLISLLLVSYFMVVVGGLVMLQMHHFQ